MMHYGQTKPKMDPEKLRMLIKYKTFLDLVEGIDTSADEQSNQAADDENKIPPSSADPTNIEYVKVHSELLAKDPQQYEQFCEAAHAGTFLLPTQLPWIPVVKSNRKLADIHDINVTWKTVQFSDPPINSIEKLCCDVMLQRMNASSTPHYLHKRYHAMDCLSLLEHSSGDRHLHFANAVNMYTYCNIYSLPFWSEVATLHYNARREFKKVMFLQMTLFHCYISQRHIYNSPDDMHLCQSAAEYLLEPWLVMQLAWHPAVYYQWLVAALAEVLRAKGQLVEFHFWPMLPKLHSVVSKLVSQVETLHRRLLTGFRLINWLANENSGSGFETNCHTVQSILELVVLPSMPIIEFLVGDEFEVVVAALKRMAWPSDDEATASSADQEELVASCSSVQQTETLLPMYRLQLDEKGNPTHIFGKIGNSLEDVKQELASLACVTEFLPMHCLYRKICDEGGDKQLWKNKKKREEIKCLLKKVVGKRLKGAVTFTEWHEYGPCFAAAYSKIVTTADFVKGVLWKDTTFIYNIHNLTSKLVNAENKAICSGFAYLQERKAGRKVHLRAPHSKGPEMSLKMAEQLLDNLESGKWTLETLKKKIAEECKSAVNCEESCPGIETGYKDVINAFELRIKKLVYHIFDMSSTKGLKECFVFPDWQFVQYMLPCFVTLIGHLATDLKTKPTEVFACIRFVHNLIQSYECNLITKHVKGKPAPLVRERDPDFPSWVCFNLAKNLQTQVSEVEQELGLFIYGSCKRMKKAGMSRLLQKNPGLLQLFGETLNRSWFGKLNAVVYRSYCEKVLQFVPRLKAAIAKEVMKPTNPFPINNLLEALSILQQLVHFADVCSMDDPRVRLEHSTLDLAHQKLKKMMGKELIALKSSVDKTFFLQTQKLTVQQLLGLALFDISFCRSKVQYCMCAFLKKTQVPQSALFDAAVEKFEDKEWSGLRSLLTPLLSDREGNDLSVVEMDIAVNTANIAYSYVLKLIEEKDSCRDDFLSLVPVLPVRFCRCCEKFADVQLSLCRVCVDNRDFPDVHWFCSQECEEKVLAQGHMEEHDVFLMKLLGLV